MNDCLRKLKWHARRGMLELDTLFQNYLDVYGEHIDEVEQLRIEHLLRLQDQELFDAFSGKRALLDRELDDTFQHIIASVHQAASIGKN